MPQRLPNLIETEEQLEELLSRPDEAVVDVFRRLRGDIVLLGAGGKIGPSLVRMACRARAAAGGGGAVYAVSRFSNVSARAKMEQDGAKTISADLTDPAAVNALPDASHVLYLVGQKFGTTDNPGLTWVHNTVVPALVARRYRGTPIVAFSTACVYPFTSPDSGGSVESDPLACMGDYAGSCVGRERVLDYFSRADGTPVMLVRLSYAVEMRYGVPVDIASAIWAGRPIDVTMGYAYIIWQGDNNRVTLRLLEHTAVPAAAINVTGPGMLKLRELAIRLGELLDRPVKITGQEAATAWLANPAKMVRLFGPPSVDVEMILRWTADWVSRGGRLLGKPTHFETRDGKF